MDKVVEKNIGRIPWLHQAPTVGHPQWISWKVQLDLDLSQPVQVTTTFNFYLVGGMMTFPIYGEIKFMFQTTNQLYF